jgi:hypothetical protein
MPALRTQQNPTLSNQIMVLSGKGGGGVVRWTITAGEIRWGVDEQKTLRDLVGSMKVRVQTVKLTHDIGTWDGPRIALAKIKELWEMEEGTYLDYEMMRKLIMVEKTVL